MLSKEHRFNLISLAYREWSKAFDALKAVKAWTWDSSICPKNEWHLYKQGAIDNATQAEAKAKALLDATMSEWSDVIPKF